MAKQPKPRWKDGKIDPDWLGAAGVRFTRGWLEARLSGCDPHVPLDTRFDEDPEALFVDLVRELGLHHPAAEAVARAALQLLDQARKGAPKVPAYFGSLMRLCQLVRLPQTSTWFGEELGELARDASGREGRWGGYEVAKQIAYAAAVQAPGYGGAASRPSWERLLEVSRYTTIAFTALSATFVDRIRHLGAWWERCNVDERDRELSYLLQMAVRDEGEGRVREVLRLHSASFAKELKREIDAVFKGLGLRDVFDSTSSARAGARNCTSAIAGAGLLRKFVLQDPRNGAG